jgi:hypothetical protein
VARFPAVPTDTLRTDADGRVWGRTAGRDALLFDPTLPDGAGYTWTRGDDTYLVTVRRPVVGDVPAGRFENAVEFSFDIPEAFDDKFSVTLAAGVGVVRAFSLFDGLGDLYSARVSGRFYTPTDVRPGAVAAPRAFPNPFTTATTIDLGPGPWDRVDIHDALGRRVARLDATACGVGLCALRWEAAGAPAGLYHVVADGARGTVSHRVVRGR